MSTKKKTPPPGVVEFIVELTEGADGPTRMRVALQALKLTVGRIAGALDICPLCLTYTFADKIMTAEDAGRVGHGRMRTDEDGVEDPFVPENCKGSVH